ncbi:hypothetical protein J6590_105605 [Homalodisca vitripennis]|nr:hypothetical protein J6590_105605 [Homalodisca vitripennis]
MSDITGRITSRSVHSLLMASNRAIQPGWQTAETRDKSRCTCIFIERDGQTHAVEITPTPRQAFHCQAFHCRPVQMWMRMIYVNESGACMTPMIDI